MEEIYSSQVPVEPETPKNEVKIPSFFYTYKKQFEEELEAHMDLFGPPTVLREACHYALLNGGKRFRPIIVFMMAKALGKKLSVVFSAMAVEFFHTASLVADDLPCMDDDDLRRNKPSVHKVFGETTALLATYGLIAAGYQCISLNAQALHAKTQANDQVCALAVENASLNTGLLGATGGQYLDIFPPGQTEEEIREILQKKTVSLFEIAFVMGWLFGGGDPQRLPEVKQAALHFGMAFQLADDIDDMEQDRQKGSLGNFAVAFGKERALQVFYAEIEAFREVLQALQLSSPELKELELFLIQQVQ